MKALAPEEVELSEAGKLVASGCVPEDLELFQDHFPKFPVLPGVLAFDIFLEILKSQSEQDSKASLESIQMVKFQDYLRPGDRWQSELSLIREENGLQIWKAILNREDRKAVTAKFSVVI